MTADEKPLMRVLIFTGARPAVMQGMMDELLSTEAPDVEVVIVCNWFDTDEIALGRRASIRRYPGESIFSLRTRIPALSGQARWIVLLEGHNHVPAGWLADLRGLLVLRPEGCSALVGGVENRTSTGSWAWASFIHTFAFHWRLAPDTRATPGIVNIALRRRLLPSREMQIGEFEFEILPGLAAATEHAPDLIIDHVQYRGWAKATALHWCNGRMTGALMAARLPQRRIAARQHARAVVTTRMANIRSRIKSHPARRELPAGPLARAQWLALCHAAGTPWGSLFGPGRAAEGLG